MQNFKLSSNKIKIYNNSIGKDLRGSIWTSWEKKKLPINFVHDKFSISRRGVFRGFHYDSKMWKLVSCVGGNVIFYVFKVNDNKKFKIKKLKLSEKKNIQILIPPGFANGHLCLSSSCTFHYKLFYKGKYFASSSQKTIKWNDERIEEKTLQKKKLILSKRDK